MPRFRRTNASGARRPILVEPDDAAPAGPRSAPGVPIVRPAELAPAAARLEPAEPTVDGGPVRPAGRGDTRAVAEVLGRAFADDPVMRWIVPDALDRAARATALFRVLVEHVHAAHGEFVLAGPPSAPTGAAIWDPPGAWQQGPLATVRALPPVVRVTGRSLRRALVVSTTYDRVHPRAPHWYLAYVGTDAPHRRRGTGAALLRPVLDRADAEGVPAYLECSDPANVRFYERLGFRVSGEIAIPAGPRVPVMWRDPRPGRR